MSDRQRRSGAILNAFGRTSPVSTTNAGVYLLGLGILGAESLVFVGRRWPALVGYVVVLGCCVFASVSDPERRSAYHALVCVPVFRLVDFGTPVFTGRTLVWLLVVYTVLLPAIHFAWRANNAITLPLWGWRGVLSLPIAIGVGIGVGFVGNESVAFPVLAPAGVVSPVAALNLAVLAFVACIEELLFRGVLQDGLVAAIGQWQGLFLSSVVFGVMYAVYGTPVAVGFGVVFGAVLALAYRSTRSLLAPMALHATTTVLLFAAPAYRPALGLGL